MKDEIYINVVLFRVTNMRIVTERRCAVIDAMASYQADWHVQITNHLGQVLLTFIINYQLTLWKRLYTHSVAKLAEMNVETGVTVLLDHSP